MTPPAAFRRSGISATVALTRREIVRLLRQPSRLIAAIATPLLIWGLLGSGFAGTYRAPGSTPGGGESYALYLLPGMLSMTVLFSAIFGAISLIEDRHEGFLQAALVSPAPRWSIAASKVLGSVALATAQAAILLPAAFVLGKGMGLAQCTLAIGVLLCISTAIAGVGLAAAWWVDSVQGFHGVMNLVLMPMWLLSGAVFPVEGASGWLRGIMLANPLTWCLFALRDALEAGRSPTLAAWAITLAFAAAGTVLAWATLGRGVRRL